MYTNLALNNKTLNPFKNFNKTSQQPLTSFVSS
jgi:hypothetical protein